MSPLLLQIMLMLWSIETPEAHALRAAICRKAPAGARAQ